MLCEINVSSVSPCPESVTAPIRANPPDNLSNPKVKAITDFRDIWIEQCEAAEEIRENFGKEKAIGYMVGEKFIKALPMTCFSTHWT